MDLKKAIKHQELKDLMEKKQQKGHHELALEIGLEALQISEEWQIYRDMGCSSLKLGRFEDAIKVDKQYRQQNTSCRRTIQKELRRGICRFVRL